MVRFTIIIPAYNLEGYIADCLTSIQNQTYENFEVLVVDDGSRDKTACVAHTFADRDSRFRVLSKQNGGVSSARNLGLTYATGEYVWFVDGDDYIHPDSLSYIEKIFFDYPEADYLTFDYAWSKKRYDGNFLSIESLSTGSAQYFDCSAKEGFENALRFSPIAVCCVCYRREITAKKYFVNLQASEDRLYSLEMCFLARAVIHTKAKIYTYYQRNNSASRSHTRNSIADLIQFIDYVSDLRLRNHQWGEKYLHFALCVEIFPGIMRKLLRLPSRADRKWAFTQLLEKMAKVQSIFVQEPTYAHIDKIVSRNSFALAWFLLYARYEPRRFLVKHPAMRGLYLSAKRWLRPEVDSELGK